MYRPYVCSFLKRHLLILLLLLLAGFRPYNAAAESMWPVIEGRTELIECKEAAFLANRYFYDNYIPDSDDSVLENAFFEKIQVSKDHGYGKEAVFWEKNPISAKRIVITKENMGWKGSRYSLFAIDKNIDLHILTKGYASGLYKPVIDNRWNQPPIINKSQKGIWAIDQGSPYRALPNWDVYGFVSDKFEKLCVVKFTPELGKNTDVTSLLPEPVEQFANQLSGTLGDSNDEGTLQSIARLKNRANKVWANVLLRPWLVSPANEFQLESVNKGLLKWSKQKNKHKDQYVALVEQRPKARAALERFYIEHFDKTEIEAQKMAQQNINAAYISYYAFPE